MKMTNAIQTPLFSPNIALPLPPDFRDSRSNTRNEHKTASPGSRFEIHDAEGYVPEILCRIMLGLCLAFTFVECLLQLAAS